MIKVKYRLFLSKFNKTSRQGYGVAHLVEALRYKPKVAGSIPYGVNEIFRWHGPWGWLSL